MRRTSALSADEIGAFWKDGYLRVGKVLDNQALDRLRRALEHRRASGGEHDLLSEEKYGSGAEPGDDPETFSTMFNLWLSEPAAREVAFDPALARWAAQLIGARQVRLLEDNSLFKEPGTGSALHWHQDQSYYPFPQPASVTAWIAVTPVTTENGAVKVAQGSHLLGERLPVKFDSGAPYDAERRSPLIHPMEQPADQGLQVDTLELEPGEASFHHSLTWHASGPNRSRSPRQGFAARYAADGVTWMGATRTEYHYSEEETGLQPGQPLGGRYFPVVPF